MLKWLLAAVQSFWIFLTEVLNFFLTFFFPEAAISSLPYGHYQHSSLFP